MGGSESVAVEQGAASAFNPSAKKGIFLLGALAKGPMVIRYSPGLIESVRAPIKLPKYAHSFLNADGVGYMSGGVE